MYIGSTAVAGGCQTAEFVQGTFFAGEFDKLISSIIAAAVGKTAELVEILSLAASPMSCPTASRSPLAARSRNRER
jgi:hypothetical protein